MSESPLASALATLYWSLHFAHNHVLFVTNGGNFIHILFFVLSLSTLLTYASTQHTRSLLQAALCYLIALFSNDIAPLFIVCYFLLLIIYYPAPMEFYDRCKRALKGVSLFVLLTIPYLLIILTKMDDIAQRDASHRINWDLDIFLNSLRILLTWLPQLPSDSWQDVFYRQLDLRRYTLVMYFLLMIFAVGCVYFLYKLIRRRLTSLAGRTFLFSSIMFGLLLLPFCFALHVTHHYILLALLFYSLLLGMFLAAAVRLATSFMPSPLAVQLGRYSGTRTCLQMRRVLGWGLLIVLGAILSRHGYLQARGHYLNPSKPTGHLFLNTKSVYDALRLRGGGDTIRAEWVFMNLETVHYRYHFQRGEWFRMYHESRKPVEVFNRPDLEDPDSLLTFARAVVEERALDPNSILVLYFDNGIFRRDLTDLLR